MNKVQFRLPPGPAPHPGLKDFSTNLYEVFYATFDLLLRPKII